MSESLDFIFERANSALITQDFEYAERLLTNALKKHQDISPLDKEKIEGLLARIYADEGDLDRSLAAYLRLYEREPDDVDLMVDLGRIYRHLERYEDALKILEKAQASTEENDEILYNLAKTYKRMRNYDKAAEYFARAIEIKPDHAHAYDRLGSLYALTGEVSKAIATYKEGLRVDPNHPYLNFHLAGLLRQEKRYEEAIVYYNAALRINPSWGEVLLGIAAAYLQLNKLDDALNTYRSLLRVTGENATIYTELGFLFEKKQLLQEAEQYYYDALVIDPGYAPAALALTRLLEKKEQYDEALPKLLSAEAAPVNADNHVLRLKTIQMCMYAKDYAKAYELFGRLDEDHNNDLTTLKLRGQLYALTGETEKAEETFKKILQTVPSAIEFRRELAEQYLLAHKYAEAKEQLLLFLKQRPTDIAALMTLGKAEELLNNPQAAYQVYQKVLDINPNAFEARSALSRLFQKRGDTIEALKTANEMLNLQSAGTVDDHAHNLAETLDLYERAAESYMTDPLLTKNLEQLKPDDSHLYIPPEELVPLQDTPLAAAQPVKQLSEVVESEPEAPFELLVEELEEAEALEELPSVDEVNTLQLTETPDSDMPAARQKPEQDSHAAYTSMPHSYAAEAQPPREPVTQPHCVQSFNTLSEEGNASYAHADSIILSSPAEELYLKSEADCAVSAAQTPINASRVRQDGTASPRQNLISRPDPTLSRLERLNTYGTSMDFLQDVISDIDKQLDEKQYSRAIELLADRIADNLSRELPLQSIGRLPEAEAPELLEEDIAYLQSTPDSEDTPLFDLDSAEETVITEYSEPSGSDTLHIEDFEGLDAEAFSTRQADELAADAVPSHTADPAGEVLSSGSLPVGDVATPTADIADTRSVVENPENTEAQAVHQNSAQPFTLDKEQQNLLWCHAKRRVKEASALEDYLNTADPEKLAELFLYLRNLFDFLPQEELDVFLNSSERLQIHYIIARLSGALGLKKRAELIQQTSAVSNVALPYSNDAVYGLFKYLRDLSMSAPDQEMGARVRQELEQLMANMSSVTAGV